MDSARRGRTGGDRLVVGGTRHARRRGERRGDVGGWGGDVLTNMNPLLPLDGYFALSDWLDVPNLRQRAATHVGWWVRRNVFRRELREPPASPRERRILLTYAALSAVHAVLVLGIVVGLSLGWAKRAFGA